MRESSRIANAAAPAVDEEMEAEPLPLPVHEGDIIAGKYRIDRLIGIGGMAAVVRAIHLELDQVVAIKLLRPEHVSKPEAVKRFLREGRAAVKLRSTHVARVLDVGTADISPTMQVPYMVMEHLEGSDFESILQTHGRFTQDDAVEYILQACDAIGEAHALGIVHRDLKPANLFLTSKRDGSALVKLLDFGISKTTTLAPRPSDNQKITHEHATMGSPAYMSPEQVRSAKDVDLRADIWSLGAILFELLSGKEPWTGETTADTFAMILTEPVPPLRAVNPDVHPELEALIVRCLEKNREARWQSVGELATALLRFAPRRSMSVAPTWDHASTPPPISGIPSSARIPLHDSQRLAAMDSQRLAALDAQRILTPSPNQAWMPPASSGHIALTPSPQSARSIRSGHITIAEPIAKAPAPWWRLPALLGAAVGLLALIGIVLFVASRARSESVRAQAAASATTTMTTAASPTASTTSPEPSANPAPIEPTPATATSAPSPIPRALNAAPARPKPAASGIPRHRTDW